MKKKFLVVALMAALSTVGYANSDLALQVESNSADINRIDKQVGANAGQIVEIGKQLQEQIKNNEGQKEEIGKLTQQVESNSADVNRIDKQVGANAGAIEELSGKVTDVENALAEKVDQSALDEVKNQGIANAGAIDELSGKVDGHAGRLDSLEGQMSETLGNIAGIDWDNKQQQEQLNKHEEALANKADKGEINDLHAKVEAVEKENERVNAEQDKVIANKADKNYVDAENKKQDEVIKDHGDRLTGLEGKFAGYDGRLSGLEKKVDHLDDKMNKGLSLMAAMNAVDFQNVQTGEMALGAGIGHYGNAQSVALGVAYSPVQDLTVNAKYSVTAGDEDSFALGAGATYKFKVGR